MVDPLTEWHDEHVRFGRLLDLLDAQLVALHAGEEPDYDLMRDVVHYLRHVADRFHHPREDAAFARLAEREPGMRLVVNRLLQEHRVIAMAGEDLMKRLDDIAAGAIVERTAVEAAMATYLVYYRHHLVTEEMNIVPRAAELLTADDWAVVSAAVPGGPDPLFGSNVQSRYEELSRHIQRA